MSHQHLHSLFLIRYSLFAAAFLMPVIAFAAAVEPPSAASAEEWYRRGCESYAAKRWDDAVSSLKHAADLDPSRLTYRYRLALATRQSGDDAQARRLLQTVLAENPTYLDAALSLADWHAQSGEYETAVAVLQPFADRADHYAVQHRLGKAYLSLDNTAAARRHLEQSVAADPLSGVDRFLLGEAYLRDDKYALATQAYQTALRLHYQTPKLHFKLASALHARGWNIAQTSVIRASGEAPDTIHGSYLLLEPVADEPDAYRACGAGSALYHVRKAIDDGLVSLEVHRLLGDICRIARRYEQAKAAYMRIADKVAGTERAEFSYHLAEVLLGLDDRDGYLEAMRFAAQADRDAYGSKMFDAYMAVAQRYAADGDRPRFIEHLFSAVRVKPDAAQARYLLGNALWEDGRKSDAVHQWRITIELQPRHPDRARILQAIQETRAAEEGATTHQ